MTFGSSAENPFKTIEDKFTAAYDPEDGKEIRPVGSVSDGDNAELIAGDQEDKTPICIFRPGITARGGSGEKGASQLFNVILGNPVEGDTSEFVIGGSEALPYGFEVLSREPFRSRELPGAEMADLARKVESSTFH